MSQHKSQCMSLHTRQSMPLHKPMCDPALACAQPAMHKPARALGARAAAPPDPTHSCVRLEQVRRLPLDVHGLRLPCAARAAEPRPHHRRGAHDRHGEGVGHLRGAAGQRTCFLFSLAPMLSNVHPCFRQQLLGCIVRQAKWLCHFQSASCMQACMQLRLLYYRVKHTEQARGGVIHRMH